MRRILARGVFAAMTTCGLLAAGPAFAGGTGMPWEGPLQQIVESIAVAVFGVGIAMSENGSAMRRGIGILFGLSIAFAASTFFLDFFGFAGGLEIG
jgi:type IV secretion system protein TrbC